MLNEVILEGIVVRDPWKYAEDLFFRVVIYRDRDMPPRKLDLTRDAGDYINVRLTGGANGLIHIRRGMRLRVHGFLQSRDYRESLEEFVAKIRKGTGCAELNLEVSGCDRKLNQLLVDRNLVEVIARRILVLENRSLSEGRGSANRKQEEEEVETISDSGAGSSDA